MDLTAPITVCRPAREADTPAVMELVRTIWGGHDYIPWVWADWLKDPHGVMAVAEYGGRVAGTAKLTRAGEDQWWLEGIRVDPQLHGKGIGTRLFDYCMAIWERAYRGPIRLLTTCTRPKVHHLCDRYGLIKVGDYDNYSAPAIQGEAHAFSLFSEADFTEILERLEVSAYREPMSDLVDVGWAWVDRDAGIIRDAFKRRATWDWRQGKGLVITHDEEENGENNLAISTLDVAPEDFKVFLRDFRRLAGDLGYRHLRWTPPAQTKILAGLIEAGFERQNSDTLFLYARTRH
ncbi:MAG TPA: GNAT family N-acetyltransferase [Anaerolineaceae bacterium]|nr:GNAT family N-acetyltransferase [Anaerolineaceae bacterium]